MKQMRLRIKSPRGLLEHRGTIPTCCILVYSCNQCPLGPSSVPGTAGRGSKRSARGSTGRFRPPGVPSDTRPIRFVRAQHPPARITCLLCPGQDSLGLQLGGTGRSRRWPLPSFRIPLAVLGAPCFRCHPSYSCLFPADQRREAARDQAGKVKDLRQHFVRQKRQVIRS